MYYVCKVRKKSEKKNNSDLSPLPPNLRYVENMRLYMYIFLVHTLVRFFTQGFAAPILPFLLAHTYSFL